MDHWTLFFVILGVMVATGWLFYIIDLIERPVKRQKGRHHE